MSPIPCFDDPSSLGTFFCSPLCLERSPCCARCLFLRYFSNELAWYLRYLPIPTFPLAGALGLISYFFVCFQCLNGLRFFRFAIESLICFLFFCFWGFRFRRPNIYPFSPVGKYAFPKEFLSPLMHPPFRRPFRKSFVFSAKQNRLSLIPRFCVSFDLCCLSPRTFLSSFTQDFLFLHKFPPAVFCPTMSPTRLSPEPF